MALSSPRFATNTRLQAAADNRPVMNWGEVGEAVRLVQQALIDLGARMPISLKRHGSPDGIFGDETKSRVCAFQVKHGLSADGIVGTNTLAKLDKLLPAAGAALPPLPKDSWITHRFKLVLRSIAMPVIPEFRALEDARTVYGQYGFRVDEGAGMSLALTPDQQLTLNVLDGACKWDQENDEQRLLFSLAGGRQDVANTDIMVYYVNGIKKPDGSGLAGCAGHKPGSPAVVVAATAAKYDMAHEVGHVLLGPHFVPVHHSSSTNLMFLNALTADPPGLTEAQVRAIRSSRSCFHL
jgi:peptidoglycan hydrolase-like protein with peptidoglycan-binding domain